MNALQASVLIEQILAQPSVPAAAQVVQANAANLDVTFFLVLQALIAQEQPAPLGSWGGSFEDRLAEGMARINSPSAPNQRLQALTMVQEYAAQIYQQQLLLNLVKPSAPPPALPPILPAARRGASGERRPAVPPLLSATKRSAPEPADDMAKAQRLMAIDRRYLPLMAEIMPGKASAKTIAALEEIRGDYETLAGLPPPTFEFYTPQQLRGKIADVLESIARCHDSLNRADAARDYYTRATEAWTGAGEPAKASRCAASLAQLKLATDGNIDGELQRLQTALAAAAPGSLPYVQLQIELGELQSRGGDDFAAEEVLLLARDALKALGFNSVSGVSLARSLEESMRAILSGEAKPGSSPIETQMQARGLQRRILLALAQVSRDSDPAKAAGYLREAKQLDAPGENEAFSQQLLGSLNSLFDTPPSPPRKPPSR